MKKKPAIGRPPGQSKTKISLTIDTGTLKIAKKFKKQLGCKSLSALAEKAIADLIEAEGKASKPKAQKLRPPPSGLVEVAREELPEVEESKAL